MIEPPTALDANVILRYLLNDVPEQGEKARTLIDSHRPLGLTSVALAEVAWTLAGPRYRRGRATVALQLMDFIARENLVALGFDKAEALAALLGCTREVGGADLGDALIAACARSAGVQEIYSFDRRFSRAGLIPIPPP